jgi:hypothetical protein
MSDARCIHNRDSDCLHCTELAILRELETFTREKHFGDCCGCSVPHEALNMLERLDDLRKFRGDVQS